MLRRDSVGYIIEKMRGDSLTPLGTGKSSVFGDVFLDIIKVEDLTREGFLNFVDVLKKYLSIKGNRFLVGKWKTYTLSTPIFFGFNRDRILQVRIDTTATTIEVYIAVSSVKCTYSAPLMIYDHVIKDRDRSLALAGCIAYVKEKFGMEIDKDEVLI